MAMIEFTQYLRPHGRTRQIETPMPDGYEAKVKTILDAGCRFEAEILTTGDVSPTVHDPSIGEDIAISVTPNGPPVAQSIMRVIDAAYARLTKGGEHG